MVNSRNKGTIVESENIGFRGRIPKSYIATVMNFRLCFNIKQTYAKHFDRHYLLYDACYGATERLFGIVDEDKPEEADRRLYEMALEFLSNCQIEDRTHYVSSKAE